MTSYQQWEYSIRPLYPGELENEKRLHIVLNDAGREGWELVTVLPGIGEESDRIILKRPLA